MVRNLDTFERGVRLLVGLFALFAALALFSHPLARLLAALIGVFSIGECVMAVCPLHASLGVRKPGQQLPPDTLRLLGLLGVQLVLAYEWWSAGWSKMTDPEFIVGMPLTLGTFASRNPFPAYREFLLDTALKNAQSFGHAVGWSQLALGLTLAATVVAMLRVKRVQHLRMALALAFFALAAGMLMNANFYLAAGWTSAGVKTSNVLMFWAQALLAYVWLASLRSLKGPDKARPVA